jgi:hypothetical protein
MSGASPMRESAVREMQEFSMLFRIRALTARDPFLSQELHELADICEIKAGRLEHFTKNDSPS